jgi:hypothetical protein
VGARALGWIEKYLHDARPALLVDPKEQALFLSGYGDGTLHPGYLKEPNSTSVLSHFRGHLIPTSIKIPFYRLHASFSEIRKNL